VPGLGLRGSDHYYMAELKVVTVYLKIEPHPTIEYPPIERSPSVYRPSTIWPLARAKKRVPPCLANIVEVLRVHKYSEVPEAVFGKQANQDIRERT
jgi:hypothetical protein